MDVFICNTWNQYLQKIPDVDNDIYFSEEYVKLYETADSIAQCVICTEQNNIMLFPFLRTPVNDKLYDFETAYGYSGPITNSTNEIWISNALKEIFTKFEDEGFICGFVRFHPLLSNQKYFTSNCFFDRKTVYIDTSLEETEIWSKEIRSKNRNMIRKAEKNGLVYKAEYDFSSMYEFEELYLKTMRRLHADNFYFFNHNYFVNFKNRFHGSAFLGTVRKDGSLISAAIFMYSKMYGHYHLEGSNYEYSSLGANNFLLWKTACEFHKMGVTHFHLGGGSDSQENNSLYSFKKGFSHNSSDFYIGKFIFNENEYARICNEWKKKNPEKAEKLKNRLLMYRY